MEKSGAAWSLGVFAGRLGLLPSGGLGDVGDGSGVLTIAIPCSSVVMGVWVLMMLVTCS